MATQITVAVGANGEVLAAKGMRDGARADRLDTEATTKQAKKAVIDKLDDDVNGRENKLGKGDPSRDPAAHARKKKQLDHAFNGLRINFQHTPLTRLTRWGDIDLDDPMMYMKIDVQGIGNEGGLNVNTETIELRRNLIHPTFRAALPEGLKPMPRYNGDNNGTFWPWPATMDFYFDEGMGPENFFTWVEEGQNMYAVEALSQYTNVDLSLYPNRHTVWAEGLCDVFGWFRENRMPSSNAIGPMSGSVTVRTWSQSQWMGFGPNESGDYVRSDEMDRLGHPPDDQNPNTLVNGRVKADDTLTGRTDEHKDPVYELFMLPFTQEKYFLLVVYTDYCIITNSLMEMTGTCTVSPGEKVDVRGPDGTGLFIHYYDATGNIVNYTRSKSIHTFPEGYYWPDFDWETFTFINGTVNTWPYISEAGSKTIQQLFLYEVVDGVIKKIEDVPQKLIDECDRKLSPNLKDFRVYNESLGSSHYENTGYENRVYLNDSGQNFLDSGPTGDLWVIPDARCGLHLNKFINDKITRDRGYLTRSTRDRSVGKGFGFGKLTTDNHFDTPYHDSSLDGFADDYFFTPMVYAYIRGYAECTISYERAAGSLPWVDGEKFQLRNFADYDGFDKVAFTEDMPRWSNQAYTGYTGKSIDVPGLQHSTHRCWNWGRPDICWDHLKYLGFGPELIGERPEIGKS